MAVVTRYVVIRHDREEGVFATQQEADAYDAMLDRAERLSDLLTDSSETQSLGSDAIEAVARLLASRTDEVLAIFAPAKGAKRAAAPKASRPKSGEAEPAQDTPTPLPKAVGQN